ncbi:hypothetical protein [Geodermatophilus obscurus]|uniref:hypothetical protein n=1 Tax=Geodermatophilus obscurus TaxID=1861 RepID=UPI00019B7B38|nr:hypothetical protein [Geodermatophilus obscurus]
MELQRADGEQPAASSARRPAALPGDTAATTSSPASTCPSAAATRAAPAPRPRRSGSSSVTPPTPLPSTATAERAG